MTNPKCNDCAELEDDFTLVVVDSPEGLEDYKRMLHNRLDDLLDGVSFSDDSYLIIRHFIQIQHADNF